jgi:hypothetical protein
MRLGQVQPLGGYEGIPSPVASLHNRGTYDQPPQAHPQQMKRLFITDLHVIIKQDRKPYSNKSL